MTAEQGKAELQRIVADIKQRLPAQTLGWYVSTVCEELQRQVVKAKTASAEANLTLEQRAARAPLLEAGNRILSLLHRCSDQATDEQRREHCRQHDALCRIWNEALVEPIETGAARHAKPSK